MQELLKVIDDDNVKVASGNKDSKGRHMTLNKDAVKASLKSKQKIEEIAKKLKVSSPKLKIRGKVMRRLTIGFKNRKTQEILYTNSKNLIQQLIIILM